MSEDELIYQCPHCHNSISFDEAGDIIGIETEPDTIGKTGLGNLRVINVDGKDWRNEQYVNREPTTYQVPASMMPLVSAKEETQTTTDAQNEALIKEHNKDLKKRNIKKK